MQKIMMDTDLKRRRLLKATAAATALPALQACAPSAPVVPQNHWSNWSGSQQSLPRHWLKPRDETELIAAIRKSESGLRVTGASHSFSALCKTDDTLFSLDHLSGVVSHDAGKLQATVWAGTRLRDLGEPLWDLGQGLINQGDVDPQAVAGACGTSTHGTGITLGSFSSVMRGVRLITADGEVIEASAARDSEVYQAARTSLGALGIASQITLQNRARYSLHEREYAEDFESVMQNLEKNIRENRHYEFWVFFGTDAALVKVLNETDRDPTAPSAIELPVDAVLQAACEVAHGARMFDHAMQKLLMLLHTDVERVGRSHKIFPSPRKVRFNEMEYELPLAQGPDCLREILEAVKLKKLNTLFPIEYRSVAADDAWLSPFYGRDSASISIHQFHEVDYKPLFAALEPIFWKYGGRPHWGKLHTLTARQLAPLYPRWDDWQRLRRRLDPRGKFLNAHLRTILEGA